MQGSPLANTQALGTQTITDRTNTTAQADISAAIATASAYANSSITGETNKITYIQNAAIDAINSSQKISFSVKADMLSTLNAAVTAANTGGTGTLGGLVTGLTGATALFTGATSVVTINSVAVTNLSTNDNTALAATQTASSGQSLALNAITALDSALTEVNTASAIQGALQNRFSAVISNLTAFSQSQTAAKSRIVDADFAAETAKLSKNQILQQAGTAMLAQANQLPSGILSLLKNG
jgi:flagellin